MAMAADDTTQRTKNFGIGDLIGTRPGLRVLRRRP